MERARLDPAHLGRLVWCVEKPSLTSDAADLLTVVNACISERAGTSGQRRYSPRLVRAFILALYIFPILHILAVCGLSVPLTVLGTQPLVDRTSTLLAQIAVLEPTWTGTINYAALVPLGPPTQSLLLAADQYTRWMRATFGLWSGTVVLFYCVRRSRRARSDVADLDPCEHHPPAPVLQAGPAAARHRARALGASRDRLGAVGRRRQSQRRRRATDASAAQHLLGPHRRVGLCVTPGDLRADTTGITIALSLFVADALVVASDPRALVTNRVRGAFCAVGTCAWPLA